MRLRLDIDVDTDGDIDVVVFIRWFAQATQEINTFLSH